MYILFLKGCVFIQFQLYGALVPRCRRKLRSCRIGLTDVRPPSLPVATKVRSVESMKWRRWNNQLNPTSSAFCMGNLRLCNGNFIFKDFYKDFIESLTWCISPFMAQSGDWLGEGCGWERSEGGEARCEVLVLYIFHIFRAFVVVERHCFQFNKNFFCTFCKKISKVLVRIEVSPEANLNDICPKNNQFYQ